MAYKSKKTTTEISDSEGNVYVIDFASMTEYPRDNPGDTVGVLRRDKIRGIYTQFVVTLELSVISPQHAIDFASSDICILMDSWLKAKGQLWPVPVFFVLNSSKYYNVVATLD